MEFSRGQIVRIKCENVLTYNSVEILPCPKLNLIIGANGTGKSTIICAIILGLGGNASVIGRATDLKQYIKVGRKHARIEIELYNPDSNYIIERRFNMNGESKFTINNKTVSLEKIEKLVKHFHIQIDNLCQILPQEKLEQFAKMNDHERLVGTLKTVGEGNLSKWLEYLKESKENEAIFRRKITSLNNSLTDCMNKKDAMEPVVKAVREKQFLIECLKLLKQRRSWQFYFHIKQTINVIDDTLKTKQSLCLTIVDALKNVMVEVESSYSQLANIKSSTKDTNDKLRELVQSVKMKQNEIANTTETIADIKATYRQKTLRAKSQAVDIASTKQYIEKTKNEIANAHLLDAEFQNATSQYEYHQKQIKKLVSSKEMTRLDLEPKKIELNAYQHQLSKFDSMWENKKRILKHQFEDCIRGMEWLENNQDLFTGQVYGPMFMYLNINNAENAKYVEMSVNTRDLVAFMCEFREDTSILVKKLREENKLKISVVSAIPDLTQNDLEPPFPISYLRQFGFHSLVSEFISGPDIIVNYLIKTFNLHCIPVGNASTNKLTKRIPNQIKIFFTDKYRFNTSIATLTGEKIESSREITETRFLTAGIDTEAVAKLMGKKEECARECQALEKKLQEISEKVKAGEERCKNFRGQLNKLRDKQQASVRLQEKLKRQVRELHEMENNIVDMNMEKNRFSMQIKLTLAKICNMYIELGDLFQVLFDFFVQYQKDKLNVTQAEKVHSRNLHVSARFVSMLKNEVNTLSILTQKMRLVSKCERAFHEWALKCTGRIDPRNPAFKSRHLFFTLSENVDVLGRLINKFQAKVNCLGGANDGLDIFRQHKKLLKEIEYLQKKVAKNENKLMTHYEKIDEIKRRWLIEVVNLIETINTNFRVFFEMMDGCAGMICLHKGEEGEEDDFSKYGIHIKVKFRKESELQILNSQIQSGGERAVSIAIYLLSLQELTTVPFRCIDEINQGMDANNERRIFDLITKATEERGNTQYFLLTPKLLPKLNFTSNCKILIPYNGVGSLAHADFVRFRESNVTS